MGLDMFMFEQQRNSNNKERVKQFSYWRKHHDLHGFFEKEWHKSGCPGAKNADATFNCVRFQLTQDILLRAVTAIKNDKLPATTGFFFGDGDYYDPKFFGSQAKANNEKEKDIAIIQNAITKIIEGSVIYYDSWW